MVQMFACNTIRIWALILLLVIFPISSVISEPKILTTTSIIADTTKSIGGSRVTITSLMGAGVDPHLYKASPGDVRKMLDADLIFYGGLHLEGRLADVLEKISEKKPTIAVTDSIPREALRQTPDFPGNYDPHVWFDVSLWLKTAEKIRDVLIKQDPDGRETYNTNFAEYSTKLNELHRWCREQIQSIPEKKRVLVTAHDAFGYFGRAYGIDVKAIQGVSTDSEASLKEINYLVDFLVERGIPAVFVESSVSRKTIQALNEGTAAKGHEVKIGGELFSDALGEVGTVEGTYIGMVQHNVNIIVNALGKMEQSDTN